MIALYVFENICGIKETDCFNPDIAVNYFNWYNQHTWILKRLSGKKRYGSTRKKFIIANTHLSLSLGFFIEQARRVCLLTVRRDHEGKNWQAAAQHVFCDADGNFARSQCWLVDQINLWISRSQSLFRMVHDRCRGYWALEKKKDKNVRVEIKAAASLSLANWRIKRHYRSPRDRHFVQGDGGRSLKSNNIFRSGWGRSMFVNFIIILQLL